MKLSSFNPLNDTLGITAGEALSRNDLVYVEGLSGKGRRVRTSDNAAIGSLTYGTPQTSSPTGMIVAQTSIIAAQTNAYSRQAVLKHTTTGDILTLTAWDTTSRGVKISQFNGAGTLLQTVNVNTTTTASFNHLIFQLSNGNVAVVYKLGSAIYYAVYDSTLVLVTPVTLIGSDTIASESFAATALSGGGFAVVFHDASSALTYKLVTYNNSGTVVQAATTIWTRTGADGSQIIRMAELSNENLVIATYSNNTVSSIGLYHGVVTAAGASVLAFTSIDATASNTNPELAVMTGYYCVSKGNSTNMQAWVYNNAGTLQGSGFSSASTSANDLHHKLLSAGTAFWLLWSKSTDSTARCTKLPVTGTGYISTDVTVTASQYGFYIDAFYECGVIVVAGMLGSGNQKPSFWIISTATGQLLSAYRTEFGVSPGATQGCYLRVISGGDGAFISLYDYDATILTALCIGKYENTAVVGVAAADAAADAVVRVKTAAGAYLANAVAGSPGKGFDMTTGVTVYGNKGTIMPNGVTLRGF